MLPSRRAEKINTPCAARKPARRQIEMEKSNRGSSRERGILPRRQTSNNQAVVAQSGELLWRIGAANCSAAIATKVKARASKRNRRAGKLPNRKNPRERRFGAGVFAGDTYPCRTSDDTLTDYSDEESCDLGRVSPTKQKIADCPNQGGRTDTNSGHFVGSDVMLVARRCAIGCRKNNQTRQQE